MRRPYRPMRSRFTRLLACVLVAASLLVNGMAIAQAPAAPSKHHGCAEMMAGQHHANCCDEAGQPCPPTSDGCDDQCMFRCQSTAVLPLLVPALLAGDRSGPAPASLPLNERPAAVLSPALRPPISA